MDIETQKKLVEAIINPNKKEIKPYTTKATVSSVSDGIIYVKLPGSENSTPIKSSSVSVNPGDVVDISVSHDDSHITGNRSDVAAPASTTKQISKALEATRLEMDNTFDLFNNEIKMLNNNVNMQNNEIEMQNNTIVQINNTVEQQNNKITEIGDDITSIGNTVVSQNNKITEIGNTVDSQNNKITEIDNIVTSQDNVITEIGNTVNSQGNTITELNNNVNSQGNTIIEIGNKVNSQNNKITEIGNTVDSQNNTITELNNTVTEIGNTVNSQGNTITEIGNTVNSQGNTITELNNTVNSQGNTITQINNTINQQNTEIETLDSNIKIINSAFIIQNGKLTGLSEIVTNILNAGYVTTDLLNADVAWIENGKIKEGAIGTVEIADESVTTAKIKDLSADVITTGTLKTECLILTTDEIDPETGEKKVALITALNAKVNAGEGNILDGAVIADESIEATKITVVDLNAFGATIGNFHIGISSMYNGKESLKDPTNGVYLGTDGIAIGQGSLLGMTDDSPFRVESDGGFHLGAKDDNYVNFDAFTGELDINAKSIKMGSKSVASTEDVDELGNTINTKLEDYATLEVTNNKISTAVTSVKSYADGKASDAVSTAKSYTDQTAESITSTVEGIDGRMTRMEQNANGFTWTIDETAIVSSVNEYYKSTSPTSLSGGSWLTSQPTWTEGTYIWMRTKNTNGKGVSSYTTPAGITGNTGAQGPQGEQGEKGDTGATGATGPKGDTGATGANGTDGRGIKSTVITYQAGSSGTSAPTGTWSSSVPPTSASAPYMWTKTVITYTDNTTSTSYSVGSTPEGIEVGGRNYIKYGKGDTKDGFFKYFNAVENGYGEHTLTSKKTYTSVDITPGYVLGCRDYEVGRTVTFSYDIMYTNWDFPDGTTRTEFWIGQRYASQSISGGSTTGTWRDVTNFNPPVVGSNGCKLNEWYHFEGTRTVPEQAADGVTTQSMILFYNSNADVSASITFRIKNVKLEYGNKATDWTPAPEDVEAATAEAAKVATNYMDFGVYDNGLTIGNLTGSSVGRNVFIDSDSVDIRNGKNVLASYGEEIVLKNGGKDVFTIKTIALIQEAIEEDCYIEATSEDADFSSDGELYSCRGLINFTITSGRIYVWHIKASDTYVLFKPDLGSFTAKSIRWRSTNKNRIEVYQDSASTTGTSYPCTYYDAMAVSELNINGSVIIKNNGDVNGFAKGASPLLIGNELHQHLEIDGNEIMAKSDSVTPSHLYLNMEGGNVSINNNCDRAIMIQDGAIFAKNESYAEGAWLGVIDGVNESGNTTFGYGGYLNNIGSTNIYGNNLALTSNNDITTNCGVILPNGNGIHGTNTSGTTRHNFQPCNKSNNCLVGYGSHAASEGTTYIYGNNVELKSKNNIKTDCNIVLPNVKAIVGLNTSGTERVNIQPCNGSNNFVLGYGSYSASEGATNIYGNKLNFYTKTYLNSTRPLKVLWSGAYYMNASQSITLSEAVSTQLNGIVLVWSKYSDGAQNYEWNCFFVPKQNVATHLGAGYVMYCGGTYPSYKYVYINNGTITGNAVNENTSASCMGLTVDNKNHCLRYVYGV